MKPTLLKSLLFCGVVCFLYSCKHDPILPDSPVVSFKDHVLPIIVGNCSATGCHPAVGGEFSLMTYSDVIENGDIKPGSNKDDSDLLEVIKSSKDNKRMPPPPAPPLTNDQIQLIELWINQGAKDN